MQVANQNYLMRAPKCSSFVADSSPTLHFSRIQRNNEHPLGTHLNRPLIKMGFFDSFSDMVAAATPWSQVEAEAPAAQKDDGAETEDSVSISNPWIRVWYIFGTLWIKDRHWDLQLG